MERRQLRRILAQQMEAHILGLEFELGPDATAEDRAEAARQKAYVLEPLLKKLRRAQGHGKQTGKLIASVPASDGTPRTLVRTTEKIDGATAEALLEDEMASA